MKRILILILPLLLLSSCVSRNEEHQTYTFSAEVVFNLAKDVNNKPIATILYDDSYINIPDINFPKKTIPGSELTIVYDGDLIWLETYPSSVTLDNGEIISSTYIETKSLGIHVDDGFINPQEIRNNYMLDNEYVIIDKEMHFVPLDEYEGTDLILTYNKKKNDSYICPPSAYCEPSPLHIAAMYSYNPYD